MTAKQYYSILTILLIIVLGANLLSVQAARADGETPTEPPAPTQVETEPPPTEQRIEPLPTEPPVESISEAAEATPAPEETTVPPTEELLTQVPASTEVVVLDESGDSLPLATQEAAEMMEVIDPIWCPAGRLPGDAGCSNSYGTIAELVSNMASSPSFYNGGGIIYFTATTGGSLVLTDQTWSLAGAFGTLNDFDLTLQGGWNGSIDSPSISGQTDFGNNYIRIGSSTSPWEGNLTLNDLIFSSVNGTAISVYTTEGDITLSNVDVNEHISSTTATLTSASGDIIVVNGSTFDGDPGDLSRGFSATTGGNITISDTSFTDAGTNPSNGRGYDGATLSAPNVSLKNVLASGNNGDGITITNANLVTLHDVIARDNGTEIGPDGLSGNDGSGVFVNGNLGSRLIIIGGTFNNNQEYGVQVGNPANTTIYIQSIPICTGNDSNAAPTNNCFNDTTILDNTAPVITPTVSSATEASGWYGSDVSVRWDVTDQESGILSSSGCSDVHISTETTGTTLTCSATNYAGLSNSASVTIKIDKTGPILSLSDITKEATEPTGAAVSYSASAADGVDGLVPISCSPVSGSLFPLGSTTVNCSASDLRGNTNSAAFLVTVADNTAPSIAPHFDIFKESHGRSGAHISYTSPSTSDAVDGAGTASCSPASGSFFQLGTTEVNCTAIDSHGNSATSSFFIHVDRQGQASTSQSSGSSASAVPLTAGEVIDLDCNSVFRVFGIKLSFVNLCEHRATVNSIDINNLPGKLSDGFTFVIGLDLSILRENQAIQALPDGSGIQMDFPLTGGAKDQFVVLYWSGSEWIEVSPQPGSDQGLSIAAAKTGIFVLVKK